jgi:hypothetical protein
VTLVRTRTQRKTFSVFQVQDVPSAIAEAQKMAADSEEGWSSPADTFKATEATPRQTGDDWGQFPKQSV